VDDEPLARADLAELLAEHGGICVAAEAASVEEAIRIAAEPGADPDRTSFDVVFLDIQLRGGSGFDLLAHLPGSVPVIFITAHDDYAIRAFEVNALDYLLKPVSPERLARAIDRLRFKQAGFPGDGTAAAPRLGSSDSVLVRTERSRCFVAVPDICAISSVGGNYTELCTRDGRRLLARMTLKEWETRLPASGFVRIHRGVIVNAGLVLEIRSRAGQLTVRVEGREEGLPASRRMASKLKV
jgi:two-component system LytT family response regulator